MARRKRKTSVTGAILGAVAIGVIVGVVIFNPSDPPPPPPEVEFTEEYDDDWGKLEAPVARAKVTQILVSWKGANPRVSPKDPERTKEEAWDLVEEVWHKYRNDPTDDNWKSLQAEHNEDSAPQQEYDVDRSARLVEPFKKCAQSTDVGFARIVESEFGYHLIRRES